MRSRAQTSEQAETVNRRLRLLSAELSGIRPPTERADFDDPHTHLRELRPVADEPGLAGPGTQGLHGIEPATTVPTGDPAETAEASAGTAGQMAPRVPRPGRHAARRPTPVPWVDLSALRGRVALSPASLAVVAVLVAVGLGVTAWWVIRDDPGVPVAASSTGPSLATPVASGAAASPGDASAGEVVVDVTGKVRDPGIVVLTPGSRVVDAIKAAGGARRGADLTGLNRARVVQDGEQIVVGVPPPPGVAASSAPSSGSSGSSGELVSLNTATTTELETLPGVGPVTAAAIVDWRETNGGFASVDQLLEVDGIGEKTLADLAPHVTL